MSTPRSRRRVALSARVGAPRDKVEEVRELQGQRFAGVADERDVDDGLSAIAGRLADAHTLRMRAVPVDGQVLTEQVDVVERVRGGNELRAHFALARTAGGQCRDRTAGKLEDAVGDLHDRIAACGARRAGDTRRLGPAHVQER